MTASVYLFLVMMLTAGYRSGRRGAYRSTFPSVCQKKQVHCELRTVQACLTTSQKHDVIWHGIHAGVLGLLYQSQLPRSTF